MQLLSPLLRSSRRRLNHRRISASYSSSTDLIGDDPVLVRDYIRSALYDPKHGYFSKRSGPVGMIEKSIRFNQLEGRGAYMQHLNRLYKQHDIAWFTPVELFKPWYAHGIAEAILRTADLSVPLKIYEIGGGSGTCAKCIMNYMMLNAPQRVYNNMTYTSVEISKSLVKRQLQTVGESQSHLKRFRVECHDATDRSAWGKIDPQPCWVIMLEVLDNLPHDLVYSPNQVSPWMEVWLSKAPESSQISEVYKPLQDPLIAKCAKIMGIDNNNTTQGSKLVSTARRVLSKVFPKPRRSWIPTGCLQLLEVLHWALPKMSLIASDFSYLPDVKVSGDRAPLVSTKFMLIEHHLSYIQYPRMNEYDFRRPPLATNMTTFRGDTKRPPSVPCTWQRKMERPWIIATTLMQRVMLTSSSQQTSGF